MSRWTFATLDGATTYVFEINPNEQQSPVPARTITWQLNPQLGYSGQRAPRVGHPWSFGGVLRSQDQYDALLLWVGSRKKIRLTDDRGDQYIVRLLTFTPLRTAGARNRHAPWRMTYTVNALIYEEV